MHSVHPPAYAPDVVLHGSSKSPWLASTLTMNTAANSAGPVKGSISTFLGVLSSFVHCKLKSRVLPSYPN